MNINDPNDHEMIERMQTLAQLERPITDDFMQWLLLHHPAKAHERIEALHREIERQGIKVTEIKADIAVMINTIKAELNKAPPRTPTSADFGNHQGV